MPKVTIIIDKRYRKIDNTYPVKIRITNERKQRYFETPYNFSEKEFKKIMFGERLTQKEKIIKQQIQEFDNKATSVIEQLPYFSWEGFEKKYFTNRFSHDLIKTAFEEKIIALEESGQISTSVSYKCAIKSLEKFAPNAKFSSITPNLLIEYEKKMLSEGKRRNTISIYLRALRSIFNDAILNGDIENKLYPFRQKENEKNKYSILSGSNIKKACSSDEIKKIYEFKTTKGSYEDRAKDFWIFSYFCNGMNIKDVCLLKYANIDLSIDMLYYQRAKTKRQKKEITIKVALNQITKNIIKKWGNKMKDSKTFVFKILNGTETPKEQYNKIYNFRKHINIPIKKIGEELGISVPLSSSITRHSFASNLYKVHKDVKLIKETLGHTSNRTADIYLGSFDDGSIKEKTKILFDF